jgi:signal peptidase I
MRTLPVSREGSLRVMLLLLTAALMSTVLMHRYFFAVYVIEGSSMVPTLHDGDTAVVNMLTWRLGRFDRGEIVLVRDGGQGYATKRIVGLPGETIDFRENRVYVNGRALEERYLNKDTPTVSEQPRFVLGAQEYLVLGDNRTDSYDSRIYGPVAKSAIMGSYSRSFWACR